MRERRPPGWATWPCAGWSGSSNSSSTWRGTVLSTRELSGRLGVSTRTVERDIERLRDAGVPFTSRPGRTGGITLTPPSTPGSVAFDTAEIAAIISALSIVGTNSSPSASTAAAKLAAVLRPTDD